MSAAGVGLGTAAETVGVDRGTLRRWRWRREQGRPLARRRGPRPRPISEPVREQAAERVRNLRGLIGVESLRRGLTGLTRRGAARIKRDTLRAMEHERRLAAAHVEITVPGVLRGFDSMELARRGHLLVSADGSIPYRTSWTLAARYDGPSVANALASDFARNGAPLVLRLDRARQHDVDAVEAVLAKHGVLAVHGPPRHPQYYGQLERQNRDHRAWLRAGNGADVEQIDQMMASLNSCWRRRRLGWSTAAERWATRPDLNIDRVEMRREVEATCSHLVADKGVKPDLGWLLAVERALRNRGLLRVVRGGGC